MSVFSQIHEDDIHLPLSSSPKSDSENHSRDPAFTLEGGMALSSTVFFFSDMAKSYAEKRRRIHETQSEKATIIF